MSFLSRVVYLLGLCLFTSIMSHIQIDLVVENQDGNSGVVSDELLDERIGNLDMKHLLYPSPSFCHTLFHKHLRLI